MGDIIIRQKQQNFERSWASFFVPPVQANLLVVTTVFISETQKTLDEYSYQVARLSKRVKAQGDLDIRER
jgi:hypothetical protein